MGKYTTINITDGNGIVDIIRPQEEIPVIYIDLLNDKSGKVATLRLNEKERALIEKYPENIRRLDAHTKTWIELSCGRVGIYDITTPELIELSELPYGAVKRKGFVKEASIRTRPELNESNNVHTYVHFSVVGEHGEEVIPIIINGLLIVPERVATAYSFIEATKNHGFYYTLLSRQLEGFEEAYEKVRVASS